MSANEYQDSEGVTREDRRHDTGEWRKPLFADAQPIREAPPMTELKPCDYCEDGTVTCQSCKTTYDIKALQDAYVDYCKKCTGDYDAENATLAPRLAEAIDRIKDLVEQDDGQAYKEAERFLAKQVLSNSEQEREKSCLK